MTLRILHTPAALAALAPAWDALWHACPDATPFQSPHWLLPWWSVFGTDTLLAATWWEGDRLAGLLPAYVLRDAGGAKLLPVGAGTTDYLDVLGAGAEPMLHGLLARAAGLGVGICDLVEVPPSSPLRHLSAPAGWKASWSESGPCPVLRLPEVPTAMRRKLRMNRNRAERAGGHHVAYADAAGLDEAMGILVALHGARWAEDGGEGVLADPAVLRFHALAAPALLRAGLLRLAVLRVGGVPAAAVMALADRSRLHFYLSGYDTGQRFVSPGTLLVGAMLDQAVAEGRAEAHFLRGPEAYKYAWGAVDRFNGTLSLRKAP